MSRFNMSKRVGEIEFLRFIFGLVIFILHSNYLFDGEAPAFEGGAFAVEFFLLVSGYLMMASMTKLQDKPIENLGKETFSFVVNKAKPIYLEIVLSYIIAFAVQWVSRVARGNFGLGKAYLLFQNSIFEVLLLQRGGVGENAVNSVIWYVQSMLLCFMFLYPLARKFPELCKRLLFPLIALLAIGWLMMNFENLRRPTDWIGFTFKSNVRTLGALCLGSVCYTVTQWLKTFRFSAFFSTVLAFVKWACWVIIIQYLCDDDVSLDDYHLLVMAIAVILTFSQQCIDTRLFQNPVSVWLGKLSLPLYLNHVYWAKYLPDLLPDTLSDKKLMVIYVGCSLMTTAFVMLLSTGLRKAWPYMKKGLAWMIVKRPKATEQA